MFIYLCSHQDPTHPISSEPSRSFAKTFPRALHFHSVVPVQSPWTHTKCCFCFFLPLINIRGYFLFSPMGLKASQRMEIMTHTLYPLSLACSKYGVLDEWLNKWLRRNFHILPKESFSCFTQWAMRCVWSGWGMTNSKQVNMPDKAITFPLSVKLTPGYHRSTTVC